MPLHILAPITNSCRGPCPGERREPAQRPNASFLLGRKQFCRWICQNKREISHHAGQKHGMCELRPSCPASARAALAAQTPAEPKLSGGCEDEHRTATRQPPLRLPELSAFLLLPTNVSPARGAGWLHWQPSVRQKLLWKML